ncbi:hypothetical protein F2Q68_00045151 [Brassica cretica]|uniref:Uncharacterized protein n=1 Tax=Brassica cretica TaxID=69181 RepID=A0A8S9LHT5_BRACR|nr:hypothetical protein F2Q68_00045151 [Brassica cretica]
MDLRSDPLTSLKRTNQTVLNERRVPRSRSCIGPEWVDLVNAITVTQHQDVLAAIGGVQISRRLHCCSDSGWWRARWKKRRDILLYRDLLPVVVENAS